MGTIVMSKTTCVVVTFVIFAMLVQVSEEQSVCAQPEPSIRKITERDGEGTNIFISQNVVGASYRFVFDAQSGKTGDYFGGYFRYILKDDIWVLQLIKPLDLALINLGNSQGLLLSVNIYCTMAGVNNNQPLLPFARLIHVRRVDEFDPVFTNEKVCTVREDAPVDSLVARLQRLFTDSDFNGKPTIIDYFVPTIYEGTLVDGSRVFEVKRDGDVILKQPLDYETGDKAYGLGVVAHDLNGQTAKTFVEVMVINVNDKPPVFANTGCLTKCNASYYSATVDTPYVGPLTSYAFGPIQAVDGDGDAIEYSFIRGYPEEYQAYVTINKQNGSLYIKKSFHSLGLSLRYLDIRVQAKSVSILARSQAENVSDVAEISIQLWLTHSVAQESAKNVCDRKPANVVLCLIGAFAVIFLKTLSP